LWTSWRWPRDCTSPRGDGNSVKIVPQLAVGAMHLRACRGSGEITRLVAGHQGVQIAPGDHVCSLNEEKGTFSVSTHKISAAWVRHPNFPQRSAANTHPVNCPYSLKCPRTRELVQVQDYTTYRITLPGESAGHLGKSQCGDRDELWKN